MLKSVDLATPVETGSGTKLKDFNMTAAKVEKLCESAHLGLVL